MTMPKSLMAAGASAGMLAGLGAMLTGAGCMLTNYTKGDPNADYKECFALIVGGWAMFSPGLASWRHGLFGRPEEDVVKKLVVTTDPPPPAA